MTKFAKSAVLSSGKLITLHVERLPPFWLSKESRLLLGFPDASDVVADNTLSRPTVKPFRSQIVPHEAIKIIMESVWFFCDANYATQKIPERVVLRELQKMRRSMAKVFDYKTINFINSVQESKDGRVWSEASAWANVLDLAIENIDLYKCTNSIGSFDDDLRALANNLIKNYGVSDSVSKNAALVKVFQVIFFEMDNAVKVKGRTLKIENYQGKAHVTLKRVLGKLRHKSQ